METCKIEWFENHLVPLHFTFLHDGKPLTEIYSAFVVDVRGYWFLVTAGHCLEEINTFLAAGLRIKACRLLDSLPSGATFQNSVPFQYEPEEVFQYSPEGHGIDYGVVSLEEYRPQLEANGVRALDKSTWGGGPNTVDRYCLLGVLGERTQSEGDIANVARAAIYVEPIDERPEGFHSAPIDMFYGRLPEMEGLTVRGMSGGPVFAISIVDGTPRYWLHAIQSARFQNMISACPVRPLMSWIEETVLEIEG